MQRLAIMAASLAAGLLTGCDAPQRHWGDRSDLSHRPGRSLALEAPRLRALTRELDSMYPGEPAWYASRNDVLPAVEAGYTTPIVETAVTYGYDRQSQSRGRVYDSSHEITYRYRVREIAR